MSLCLKMNNIADSLTFTATNIIFIVIVIVIVIHLLSFKIITNFKPQFQLHPEVPCFLL